MGIGDEIMATGMARGMAARGKQAAFGDGKRIIWGPWCEQAFAGNHNIAGKVHGEIEWIEYYKGKRRYNQADNARERWIWNYEFKAVPGEFYFTAEERAFQIRRPGGVLIEPNVPWHKSVAINKDWGWLNYQTVADLLRNAGYAVFQNSYGKVRLRNVETVVVGTFRQAAASLAGYDLIICPEGGLHHAAAAVGTPAVVIFGGFIPPQVTGYESHVNLTGGAEACGSWKWCVHCRQTLDRITVEQVYEVSLGALSHRYQTASRRAG